MPKLCLLYANCQGIAISHFLNKSPPFRSNYTIEHLCNYQMISQKQDVSRDLFKRASLFIYQPINGEYEIYSTDTVLSYLSDACLRISCPYIYNDAFWPLFKNGKGVGNAASITDLLDEGASVVEVALQFLSLKMDFRFQQRFHKTVQILAERESGTTIKTVPYILDNYKTEKLFLTHNHPSSALWVHCVNQVLSILQYPSLNKEDYSHPNEAGLSGYFPMSPYEKAHYQLCYDDSWKDFYAKKCENNWKRFYLLRIMEVCLARHKEKCGKYYYEKTCLKLMRSLSHYLFS